MSQRMSVGSSVVHTPLWQCADRHCSPNSSISCIHVCRPSSYCCAH